MLDTPQSATSPDSRGTLTHDDFALSYTRHYATEVCRNALINSDISSLAARFVLQVLALNTDADGVADVSVRRLARMTRLSDRSVRRAIRALEDVGEIVWTGGHGAAVQSWRIVVGCRPERWRPDVARADADRRHACGRHQHRTTNLAHRPPDPAPLIDVTDGPDRPSTAPAGADTVSAGADKESALGRTQSPQGRTQCPHRADTESATLRPETLSEGRPAEADTESALSADAADRLTDMVQRASGIWGGHVVSAERGEGGVIHVVTRSAYAATVIARDHDREILASAPPGPDGRARRVTAAAQ